MDLFLFFQGKVSAKGELFFFLLETSTIPPSSLMVARCEPVLGYNRQAEPSPIMSIASSLPLLLFSSTCVLLMRAIRKFDIGHAACFLRANYADAHVAVHSEHKTAHTEHRAVRYNQEISIHLQINILKASLRGRPAKGKRKMELADARLRERAVFRDGSIHGCHPEEGEKRVC